MTIQLFGNAGASGTVKFPAPSSTVYTVTNGFIACNGEDLDVAIQQGWNPGQAPWQSARIVRMAPPVNAAWSTMVTWPDSSTAAITAGVVLVPAVWVVWAKNFGFQVL